MGIHFDIDTVFWFFRGSTILICGGDGGDVTFAGRHYGWRIWADVAMWEVSGQFCNCIADVDATLYGEYGEL